MERDVFISYRSEDRQWADRICADLEARDLKCWIAPRDIPIGKEWATAIVENLRACKAFVLVLSSNSKNARQIAREAELADQTGLPIVTVRVEDVQPPPELLYFIGNVQWLDAFGDQFESAISRLTDVARAAVTQESGAAMPTAMGTGGPTATPSERPMSPVTSGKWIAVGGAVLVLIGGIAWFSVRRSETKLLQGQPSTKEASTIGRPVTLAGAPNKTAPEGVTPNPGPAPGSAGVEDPRSAGQAAGQAAALADRFMALIKSEDVEGALKLATPGERGQMSNFESKMQLIFANQGAPSSFDPGACSPEANGQYLCLSALRFKKTHVNMELRVKHTAARWVITGLHFQQPSS